MSALITKNNKLKTTSLILISSLFKVSCFIFLVMLITGCSTIGSSKPAALQITTNPETSVFLNGKHIGKSPYFSDQLKSGDYTIKLSTSDANYSNKITLNEGTLTVVNRELASNFQAQSGEVLWLEQNNSGFFISSIPPDANVSIDGRHIGKTPINAQNLEEGEHKVVISHLNYENREFAVKTSKKFLLNAEVTLALIGAKGNGNISSIPSPQPQTKKIEILKTPQGFLRMRKASSLESQEVVRVPDGTQLEIIQETTDWIQVKYKDKIGWVSSQFTKKL